MDTTTEAPVPCFLCATKPGEGNVAVGMDTELGEPVCAECRDHLRVAQFNLLNTHPLREGTKLCLRVKGCVPLGLEKHIEFRQLAS